MQTYLMTHSSVYTLFKCYHIRLKWIYSILNFMVQNIILSVSRRQCHCQGLIDFVKMYCVSIFLSITILFTYSLGQDLMDGKLYKKIMASSFKSTESSSQIKTLVLTILNDIWIPLDIPHKFPILLPTLPIKNSQKSHQEAMFKI